MKMTEKKEFIEPVPIKAGNTRLLLNGKPIKVDCRLIAEEGYQMLKEAYDQMNLLRDIFKDD